MKFPSALLAAALVFAGCAGTRPVPPLPFPSGESPPSRAADEMNNWIRMVDAANVKVAGTMVHGAAASAPRRDQDESRWEAGGYQLVVKCVGAGGLKATLRIGEKVADGSVTCASTVRTLTIEVVLTAPATGSVVTLMPETGTTAAFAYQIQKGN